MEHTGIRPATPADSEQILRIYAPFIDNTAITFETEVPTVEAFASRIAAYIARYPYLVWEEKGIIEAYAYASRQRDRAAYDYNVEVSVYAADAFHGTGIARRLYDCLFELLREQGFRNAYAGYTEPNPKSERFHKKMGFVPVGTYRNTGYKLGSWHDVTWAEKTLLEHTNNPPPPRDIGELPGKLVEEILARYSTNG